IDGRGTGLGVARADGSDAHLLFQGSIQIWQPVWSPDGSRLAYLEAANGVDGNLRVVRADGTDARILATGASGTPQWSPDGSLIAFTQGPERTPVVAVIKPDGTQYQRVAAGSDPVWRTAAPLPPDRRPCIVRGTARADVIHGTARGDVILAGPGNDRVYGGGGDDVIVGGLGQDRLYGGPGNDRFDARDRLRDYVFGGPGTDRAFHDPVDRLFSIRY
ncbi:MAG TPA: hypothetical protein VI142_02125, partial [Gaiellaceae bacterium]